MRKTSIALICCVVSFIVIKLNFVVDVSRPSQDLQLKEINGKVQKGETLFHIFKKYNIDPSELFKMKEASANIHRLREVHPGQDYKIVVDEENKVNKFVYWIDDDNILNISQNDAGFQAEKLAVEYDRRTLRISGVIQDNLISSLNSGSENLALALQLSDIFAWEIDFTCDLRKGDVFKVVVEGLYLHGGFKKYGEIMSAEFGNNGQAYKAYRFEYDGRAAYYNENGKSLKKAFLKAPLSFRRISSRFSGGRYHPILKIYRPHHGLDYGAAAGTPVSAIGNGTVKFARYRGQYGNLVIIRHSNGWKTYYGHLSRISKGIKAGVKTAQGQIIGYVGSTGLATGPHLHYELRIAGRPVNPLTVKMPAGKPLPKEKASEFARFRTAMNAELASISVSDVQLATEDSMGSTKKRVNQFDM
ncbi:MAG: peptidoglycan DD-metalloendopeptidase family protein [Proteobacteria bacterium]|nr:peptidoglycan DD-metalloendopeptidase family protein [Pseudomonadota bacterium]